MHGSPPPPEWRVTRENWDRPPFNRWSFQNVSKVHRTAPIRRGDGPSTPLAEAPCDLESLSFDSPEGSMTVSELLDRTYADGIIVLHRGTVLLERYYNGMAADSLHLSQSIAKSVTGAAFGILVGRGLIDPQRQVEHYVPELSECGYGGALVQHVLDMRSGVDFDEDYTNPNSHMGILDRAAGWKPRRADTDPECIYDLILSLKQSDAHGRPFKYRSIETDVLALIMERVTGSRLADIVSRELWAPLGAEHDALFTIDSAGQALADGGFAATLRDYARFGQMILSDGFFNGQEIVPAEWIAATRDGDTSVFSPEARMVLPKGAYRNQFWIEDVDTGVLMCRGVFGQAIYLDHNNDLTIVKLSSWPDFINIDWTLLTLRACHAIAGKVSARPQTEGA